MKIALNEIWNFLDLLEDNKQGWHYSLLAGNIILDEISIGTMQTLKVDDDYDTELLSSIFTYREILWQPDVFTEVALSVPPLRILNAFCEEVAVGMEEKNNDVNKLYANLIKEVGNCCDKAIVALSKDRANVKKILGNFRTCTFPIIKFFIYHPKTRQDYFIDAINRLNYAVKIMLTQFYGRYTELEDPYWLVSFSQTTPKKQSANNFKEQ